MRTLKALTAAAVIAGFTVATSGSAFAATNVCAPGQHGNKAPGYKPAVCAKR